MGGALKTQGKQFSVPHLGKSVLKLPCPGSFTKRRFCSFLGEPFQHSNSSSLCIPSSPGVTVSERSSLFLCGLCFACGLPWWLRPQRTCLSCGTYTQWSITRPLKKNTFESVLMRWMKLEPIIQSEVSQKEKHQYSILTHIYMEFRKMAMMTLYARQEKRHRCV